MKSLIIFGLFLVVAVEFSYQIPVRKNERKVLPLPTKDRKSDKFGVGIPAVVKKEDEASINREPRYFQISNPQTFVSSQFVPQPCKNQKTRDINENDDNLVLSDDELVDLIVNEATDDLIEQETSETGSDGSQQRQKRGWFKKIWRSAEKRFKENLPVAVSAAVGGAMVG